MIPENNQNHNLDTFIAIKIDTENNETTPAISFDRIHEYFIKFTKNDAIFSPKLFQPQHKSSTEKRIRDKYGIGDLCLVGGRCGPCCLNLI